MTVLRIIAPVVALFGLTQCHPGGKSVDGKKVRKNGIYPNKIDASAKQINAKLSKEYDLNGNVIANYPTFSAQLVSTEVKDGETISFFQVASKHRLEFGHLKCSTAEPGQQHLYMEDLNYYYHSNKPGTFTIYYPESIRVNHQQTPTLSL